MAPRKPATLPPATSTEVATIDEGLLDAWRTHATGEDTGEAPRAMIPILKLIPEGSDSGYAAGTWVIGLRKDRDENIVEAGEEVKSLIILAVRNRYNYYNSSNTAANCFTGYFKDFTGVRGRKYGNLCKECTFRDPERNPRCKAQKVIFGIAITESGKRDCIAYLQGASYMPFSEYLAAATLAKVRGAFEHIPAYGFVTILGSEKVKEPGKKPYYKAAFTRGAFCNMEEFTEYHAKHLETLAYIEAMAKKSDEPADDGEGIETPPPARPPKAVEGKVIDIPSHGSMPLDDDIPFEAGKTGPADESSDDFDIEAAIRDALKDAI